MGNRFTFLLMIGALLTIGNVVKAQDVTLSLSPASVTIDTGDMVTVSIFAENFNSVSGFSGTIDWDPNVLSFVEIPPLTISLPGMATNPSMISQGKLLFNWFDLGAGVTIDNTTPIFEIVFDAEAAGVSDVILDSTPVPTQVIQGVNEYVPVSTGSSITVTGPPTPPNDSNFDWDCTDFTELAFYASFDSINTGESTCLDVAVCNFDQITSFGFTMEFDSALLQFDSVANFQLTQLVSGNFGTTNSGQGFVNVAWFEEQGNGIDVADESTIFEICFTAIGPGGSLDSLKFTSTQTTFSAADTSLMPIPVESGNGHVVITGTSSSAVSIFASDETVNVGGNTCVDIMCADFDDMFSMGFTMKWDESIIEYDTILDPNNFFNGAILSSTNTSPGLVDTGALTVTWLSPSAVTLADSTVLFQVCYDAAPTAAPNDVSAVQFTGSQLSIDASQDDGTGNPVSVPLATTDGSVTINPDSNPDGFVFNLSDTTGCEGDTVTISFLATGFQDVAIISGQINWDTSQIKWVGLHSAILPPLFTPNTSAAFTDAGKMTFVWFDLAAVGKTFDDNTKWPPHRTFTDGTVHPCRD